MSNKYLKKVIAEFIPNIAFSIPAPSADKLAEAIERLTTADEFIHITHADKGTIFGLLYRSWWNPDVIIAQELGWWTEPEYRGVFSIKLYKQFEAEAKARGATVILATAQIKVEHEKTCQLYQKLGMVPTETVFFKEV